MNVATNTIEIPPPCHQGPSLARVTASATSALSASFFVAAAEGSSGLPTAQRLLAELGGYCEALFEQLAVEAPNELIQLVRYGGLRPSRLTFAAEALGHAGHPAVPLVLELLNTHPSALVREGAVYGALKAAATEARPVLDRLAVWDPSPGVREAAASVLELL